MNDNGPITLNDGQLRQMQLKELDALLYFKEFCDENGLLFYFCGGCCIGSLRTGGFVPWDDDIDVFMPRDDYEKLHALWKENQRTRASFACAQTIQYLPAIFLRRL